jgi:hypothetical protein
LPSDSPPSGWSARTACGNRYSPHPPAYEHIRDEARRRDTTGLFFECLPDDPDRCRDLQLLKQNAARLRFYEHYGARPNIGTAYETPVPGHSADNLPFLMFDDLGRGAPLRADFARKVVRAILTRKYSELCPPDYVETVVRSFVADPVPIRPPKYRTATLPRRLAAGSHPPRVALTVNDRHHIHHIRERGYVESPVRISVIEAELTPTGLFE